MTKLQSWISIHLQNQIGLNNKVQEQPGLSRRSFFVILAAIPLVCIGNKTKK